MKIELRVEELVLHGFPPGDRYRIGKALERELARLFAEQGVPPSLADGSLVERIDGGAFKMAAGSRAEAVGAQVAMSVYRGLKK